MSRYKCIEKKRREYRKIVQSYIHVPPSPSSIFLIESHLIWVTGGIMADPNLRYRSGNLLYSLVNRHSLPWVCIVDLKYLAPIRNAVVA